MAAKKDKFQLTSKKKQFTHPGINHSLIQSLERIEDVRKPSQFFHYSLTSVLFMVLVAQVCGAKDWPIVVLQFFSGIAGKKIFCELTREGPRQAKPAGTSARAARGRKSQSKIET